jgi:Xaa-Pro aminopeptidase
LVNQTPSIPKPERGFSIQEFQQRLVRAQTLMREQGLDLMLLSSEPEVRYFSGFFTQFWLSPTRPWFLLVPAEGEPVAVIPGIGETLMRSTWIQDIRCWPSPRPQDEGVSLLADTLRELVGEQAVIGLIKGHESVLRMPLQDLEHLQMQLPAYEWVNCTPLIRRLRLLKSAAEIDKLKFICSTVSQAFDMAGELFYVGQPLEEAFRAFKIALLKLGADDVPYLVGGAGQGGYGDVISPPSTRPLQVGDVLMLDTGATFDGYFADFDRNYALGRASDTAQRTFDVLYRATVAGIVGAQPGVCCAEVYQAMHSVIEKAGGGGGGVGRMGHGLGMQLTEWPSMMASDETLIEDGMVLTL